MFRKLQAINKKGQTDPHIVNPEQAGFSYGKGVVVEQELALKNHTFITDTGGYHDFKEFDDQQISADLIRNLYKKCIANGFIDHHGVDIYLTERGITSNKCATAMVNDFAAYILAQARKNNILKSTAHIDPDLDAIASQYLLQHLLQKGKLPKISKELAEITNNVDYGKYGSIKRTPNAFANSLPGIFSALKNQLDQQKSHRLGKEVFGNSACKNAEGRLNELGITKLNELNEKYNSDLIKAFFSILDNLEKQKARNQNFRIDDSTISEFIPPEYLETIQTGQKEIIETYKKFNKDFAKAQKLDLFLNNKKINLFLANSTAPLSFTNLAYNRVEPNSIIAVFAGTDRVNGDHYDIGIIPDLAQSIDLKELCILLNQAEAEKRAAIYNKKSAERTEAEKKLIETWENQNARETFPGIVIKKDPTVLVSAGSLIAASRTALLTWEDFQDVIKRYIQNNDENYQENKVNKIQESQAQ